MRTSSLQFKLLVEFMKRNGDISKPAEGPEAKALKKKSWSNITKILNANAYGDIKTVDKWRKVWSDLKSNTRRKAALFYRATSGSGSGRITPLKLSALEKQILTIITPPTTTRMADGLGMGLVQGTQAWNESTHPPKNASAWEVPYSLPALPSTMENKPDGSRRSACTTYTFSLGNAIKDHSLPSAFIHRSVAPEPVRVTETSTRVSPRSMYHRLHRNESQAYNKRTQTQPELPRQAFVNTDNEWHIFQRNQHYENVRIKERELQQQQQWLEIFTQFVGLGNRFMNYLEKK